MPTKVVFENAALADAVNKAAKVAPTKGSAFDQASGILFVINVGAKTASVRATDIDSTFEQVIPIAESQGSNIEWRIPSSVLSGLVSQLPMSSESFTEFIDRGDGPIRLKSGRIVAKLNMLDASTYPRSFDTFPADGMAASQQLSNKLEQVAWAVDSKSQILSGVHVDGRRLIGCNQYLVAVVPCEVPIESPVTVPLTTLSSLLKGGSDVRCRAVEKRFQILLDSDTRVTTTLLAGNFPNIDVFMRKDFHASLIVHRQSFIDTLNAIMVLIRQERLPRLQMEINGTGLIKLLTFDMEVPDLGRMQNSIDIETEWSDVYKISLSPKMTLDAASGSKAERLTINFGHADPSKTSFVSMEFTDDQGYKCHVMPRKPDD